MIMVTATTIISFLKHNHYNTNPPGPVEFFFKYNFPTLSQIAPQIIYKIKRLFSFEKKKRLPFDLTYTYTLAEQQFEKAWDTTRGGNWRQLISIKSAFGITYTGVFTLGARPDGFFNFKEFTLVRWGEDSTEKEIPIGTNLIEMDKEMHDIIYQIAENLRIPSTISPEFLQHWNKITDVINNFEVMRTHNKLCKKPDITK